MPKRTNHTEVSGLTPRQPRRSLFADAQKRNSEGSGMEAVMRAMQTVDAAAKAVKDELNDAQYAREHDVRTDLLTEMGLEKAMRQWAKKHDPDAKFRLVILDLDGFGEINKLHGLAAGDRAIEVVADILRGAFHREGELIARAYTAGDEFKFFLPEDDKSVRTGADKRGPEETHSQHLIRILRSGLQERIATDSELEYMREIDFSLGDETYEASDIVRGIEYLSEVPDKRMREEKVRHKREKLAASFGEYSI